MAKKKTESSANIIEEELSIVLADTLNKKFKETNNKIAFFLSTDEDSPSNVTEWISTGNDILDLAISNKKHGGLPVGRIIEIIGETASGKSLLTAAILANAQKKGGLAVYIDTENAVSNDFFQMLGLDLSKMLYIPVETIEDAFDVAETIIERVRATDKNRLVSIAVDSIMGASTKVEMQSDYEKDGYATTKAIVLSKAMRKITNMIGRQRVSLVLTNQLRDKVGAFGFGEKTGTSGGKAVGFHSSVRLKLINMGKIKLSDGTIVGAKTKCSIIKNRMGPPLRDVEYDIYFDSGIDSAPSWVDVMDKHGIIKKTGLLYTYLDKDTGEEFTFKTTKFQEFTEKNPDVIPKMYDEICDAYIMKYNPATSTEETILDTTPSDVDA